MQRRSPNFFYDIKIDDDGHLQHVFWADARSRAVYESFGDVVTFDSTYLTNKYSMPFAPFVGVNHHGQSILFGCGLISGEDAETYVWLFKSWLACMDGHAPKSIITDQCRSMQAAVAQIFPESYHRLCLWHIMKKIPEKLGAFKEYKSIKKTLKSLVYESLDPQEFEDGWSKMIEDYNLEKHEWLFSLFNDRRRWVPIYVKVFFWAGMSTTQRSESMNAFFDGYVNSKTSLRQFVEQYDNALKNKIEKENKADFDSLNSSYKLITGFYFERQFHECYTNAIFKLFQDELRGMLFCNYSLFKTDDTTFVYHVTDIVERKHGLKKRVVYNVSYNVVGCDIKCSCHLFEFRGIVCRHMVKILIEKDVKELPSRYILSRWRKDVKHRYNFITNCYDNLKSGEQLNDALSWGANPVSDSTANPVSDSTANPVSDSTANLVSDSTAPTLLPPSQGRRGRGRPPKRKKSIVEKVMEKQNKKNKKNASQGKKDKLRVERDSSMSNMADKINVNSADKANDTSDKHRAISVNENRPNEGFDLNHSTSKSYVAYVGQTMDMLKKGGCIHTTICHSEIQCRDEEEEGKCGKS
ncbi:FAR-RED impaired response 1-like protein isoform X1 [Tanacetum coccineum]